MPTVDEFISRFSGSGATSDREARQYYDRFASRDPDDAEFDHETMAQGVTEYLGQLPEDQFCSAAIKVFQRAGPQERESLLGGLIGGLQGHWVNAHSLMDELGISSLNPQQMQPDEFARLANFTRQNHPDVMRETVQLQPWIMKAMGDPILTGALGKVASHMMENQFSWAIKARNIRRLK